jgi:hypothetical protein
VITYPSSSIIWNVLLESFAIATQLRAKMPYGAESIKRYHGIIECVSSAQLLLKGTKVSLTIIRDFNAEGKLISDAHSFHLTASAVNDANAWWRSLRSRCNADHLRIPVTYKLGKNSIHCYTVSFKKHY